MDERQGRHPNGEFGRSPDTANRDSQAATLRAQGWTFDRIANELGWHDKSGARKAVERALAATVREAGDELRALALERLDRLLEQAWEMMDGTYLAHSAGRLITTADGTPVLDIAPRLAAMDRILRIEERRAKLVGLDAPVKVQHFTLDAIDSEIQRLEQELARAAHTGGDPTSGAPPAS